MFTGIVAAQGQVTDLVHHEGDLSIQVDIGGLCTNDIKLGESISSYVKIQLDRSK